MAVVSFSTVERTTTRLKPIKIVAQIRTLLSHSDNEFGRSLLADTIETASCTGTLTILLGNTTIIVAASATANAQRTRKGIANVKGSMSLEASVVRPEVLVPHTIPKLVATVCCAKILFRAETDDVSTPSCRPIYSWPCPMPKTMPPRRKTPH